MVIVTLDDTLPVMDASVVQQRTRSSLTTAKLGDLHPVGYKESTTPEVTTSYGFCIPESSVIETVENSKLVMFEPTHPISTSEQTVNQFINAVLYAYNNHTGLRLSPDDVLQCVAMAVSNCINDHSEEYRDMFVNHSGKKKLVVYVDNLHEIPEKLSVAIDKNIKSSLGLEPAFTTTTRLHGTVASLTKMASFKKYFSFGAVMMCGIRMVDLTGTFDDWSQLRVKVENVGRLMTSKGHMVNWSKHILSLIDRLIETYQVGAGQLPEHLKTFWSRIVTYIPYGSGGEKYISGWVKVLTPGSEYDKFPETCNLLDPAVPYPTEKEVVPPPARKSSFCDWFRKKPEDDEYEDKSAYLYYDFDEIVEKWAGLTFDVPRGCIYVEVELNDNGNVSDLYYMAGFVGMEISKGVGNGDRKDDNFVQPVIGYTTHAAPKEKADVTDGY